MKISNLNIFHQKVRSWLLTTAELGFAPGRPFELCPRGSMVFSPKKGPVAFVGSAAWCPHYVVKNENCSQMTNAVRARPLPVVTQGQWLRCSGFSWPPWACLPASGAGWGAESFRPRPGSPHVRQRTPDPQLRSAPPQEEIVQCDLSEARRNVNGQFTPNGPRPAEQRLGLRFHKIPPKGFTPTAFIPRDQLRASSPHPPCLPERKQSNSESAEFMVSSSLT